MKELQRFMNDLKESKELQARLEDAFQAAKINGAKSVAEAMTLATAALGYCLTDNDIDKAIAEVQEFSADELSVVSGGAVGDSNVEGRHPGCLNNVSILEKNTGGKPVCNIWIETME